MCGVWEIGMADWWAGKEGFDEEGDGRGAGGLFWGRVGLDGENRELL